MRRMYDENEIKSIASESGGGKLYLHKTNIHSNDNKYELQVYFLSSKANQFNLDDIANSIQTRIYEEFMYSEDVNVKFYKVDRAIFVASGSITLQYFNTYPYDNTNKTMHRFERNEFVVEDTVTEL